MIVSINSVPKFRVTSDYGVVDSVHLTPHTGVDLSMQIGTDIYSPVNGVIEKIFDYGNEGLGKGLIIKTRDGQEIIFGHMSEVTKNEGFLVYAGQKVGESGSTGNSTGGHLHIGLKDADGNLIDPSPIVDKFQDVAMQLEKFGGGTMMKIDELGNGMNSVGQFFSDMRNESLWYAVTGHNFVESIGLMFKNMGSFMLNNNDIFLLMPAILFMLLTFFIGTNRTTKLIIPTWFFYFVTEVFDKIKDVI